MACALIWRDLLRVVLWTRVGADVAADALDPFAVLGVARSCDVDGQAIEAAYLKRAARLHPDLASGDPAARDAAEHAMASLNEARTILRDDETRANVLLDLLGGPDGTACRDLPPGFLEAMMAKGLEIEDALSEGCEALAAVEADLTADRTAVIDEARGLFKRATADDTETRREVRLVLNRWRYLERLLDRLHGAEAM